MGLDLFPSELNPLGHPERIQIRALEIDHHFGEIVDQVPRYEGGPAGQRLPSPVPIVFQSPRWPFAR